MKIRDLNLHPTAIKYLLSAGFERLYPPQAASIDAGLLDGQSVLVSAPTASGKTLIAIIAILGYLSKNNGKVVYLSPLRALAAEKFTEFSQLQNTSLDRPIKVGIDTGDYGQNTRRGLAKNDVLVLTNEKMDSIIRRGEDWLDEIGLVISDEVHLIGDTHRGPALEMVLTQLKRLDTRPQILGLSATVTNSQEIADWLECNLVTSTWRPVPLTEGVCDGQMVVMNDGREFTVPHSVRGTPVDLGVQSVFDGGQSLIFAPTRSRSKSMATKAASAISDILTPSDTRRLARVSNEIMDKNEHTDMVKTLSELVKKGVAFHHAGLNQLCREIIEDEFRRGTIKLLSSTPTLAAGVNLPARRVIISSIRRYNMQTGYNMPISILEYKQLCGRAGRPQYDEYGESIVVERNSDELIEHYINGTPEPIESGMLEDGSLRTNVLSIIVTDPGMTKDDILEFFLQTLGGEQNRHTSAKFAINLALGMLVSSSMIVQKNNRYAATELGKRTSFLYIDPVTATTFLDALKDVSKKKKKKHTLGLLQLIANCEEFYPRFELRNKDSKSADMIVEDCGDQGLDKDITAYDVSRSLLALHAWISEASEIAISGNLGLEAGDMNRLLDSANRLLYCLGEIAKIAKKPKLTKEINILGVRVKYGIKEELVELVEMDNVGRARARALYNNNIKTVEDVSVIPYEEIAKIDRIGAKLAKKIKSEANKILY